MCVKITKMLNVYFVHTHSHRYVWPYPHALRDDHFRLYIKYILEKYRGKLFFQSLKKQIFIKKYYFISDRVTTVPLVLLNLKLYVIKPTTIYENKFSVKLKPKRIDT